MSFGRWSNITLMCNRESVRALLPGLALQVPSRACGRLARTRRCLEHHNASNTCVAVTTISEISLPLALKETSSALPRLLVVSYLVLVCIGS